MAGKDKPANATINEEQQITRLRIVPEYGRGSAGAHVQGTHRDMSTFESRHVYAGTALWHREAEGLKEMEAKFAKVARKRTAAVADPGIVTTALEKLAKNLEEHKEELAGMISKEVGRCIGECEAEIAKSVNLVRYYNEHGLEWLSDREVNTQASLSWVGFEPLGTILAVMPWNYPVWQPLRFAIPAMRAGNGAMVKPAPGVGFVTQRLMELIPEELPMDVLWISHGDVEAAIEASDGLAFTGSVATGSHLSSLAGKHLKKSVMELGGSNAFIVLEDADLEKAAVAACYSRFRDAGQSCNAAKRLILEEGVADRFMEIFLKEAEKLHPGDPESRSTTLAALHLKEAPAAMDAFVKDAVSHGAEVLMGGKKFGESFYEATILDKVDRNSRVAREEVFGPVLPVFRVKDHEEALALANDSVFGLGASIYAGDLAKAREMAKRVEAGSVYINRHTSSDLSLPFGGVKKSGYGRELSSFGIYEFVNVKTYWQK